MSDTPDTPETDTTPLPPAPLRSFILLDRSGSMAAHWIETIGSLNAYAAELGKTTPDALITLTIFDSHSIEDLRADVRAGSWEPLAVNAASPRAGTPLYDAIVQLTSKALSRNAPKTQIVIITDGEENQSREATQATARAALDRCRQNAWDVVFLGAAFENFAQGASLGSAYATTAKMAQGTYKGTMAAMAVRASNYAAGNMAANSDLGAVRAAANTVQADEPATPA